ncbi:MAG: sigma-70 family RNA polymerase sigma factor [Planctomycetes bacterium]|nr:sigma-70 family RNA polymerase sigma factor [Planctomycetota bacterium]
MQAQKEQPEAGPRTGDSTPTDPLVALAAGDVGPFEEFVRGQTPLFLAFFRRLGAGPADAEDLTQEVMLRLFKSADRYQTSGRFEAFAFRVARNAWIDRRRKASVRPQAARGGGGDDDELPDPLDLLTSREPSPESAAESQETQESLFAALAQLSNDHREAFRLGVLEKVPYSEIAQHLKVPVGTVKSRVFHAVRHLRQLLGSETAPLPGRDS